MKTLIINADDLGFSNSVNRAVLRAVAAGNVSAASVMVNMPAAEAAFREVRSNCPNLSLALHFTLTSGRPVAPPESIPLLVDEKGFFNRNFIGLWRLLVSKKNRGVALEQIRMEFRAQLDRMDDFVRRFELRFDHLDSHQHVHVLPGLLDIFVQEAKKRNVVARIPRESFGGFRRVLRRFPAWFPAGIAKREILRKNIGKARCHVGYFGILESGRVDGIAIAEILRSICDDRSGRSVFELNVHPSSLRCTDPIESSEADRAFHESPWRYREFETLTDENFPSLLERHEIRIAGFS